MDGHRSGEQTVTGHRGGTTDRGDGPACGASGGPALSLRVCARLVERWLQGLSARHCGPFWLLGSPGAPPRQRPVAEATLEAAAWAAVCPRHQAVPASAPGGGETPRGVRHAGGHRAGLIGVWMDNQYVLCGAAESGYPAARGGGRASCEHAVSGRERFTAATRVVPH